mgnify:CR=1 FL=1
MELFDSKNYNRLYDILSSNEWKSFYLKNKEHGLYDYFNDLELVFNNGIDISINATVNENNTFEKIVISFYFWMSNINGYSIDILNINKSHIHKLKCLIKNNNKNPENLEDLNLISFEVSMNSLIRRDKI